MPSITGRRYFTVRDPRFARRVESWRREGLVAEWKGVVGRLGGTRPGRGGSATVRQVGVPGMDALCEHLALDIDLVLETRIDRLAGDAGRWRPVSEGGEELRRYDAVVVAMPAPQAAHLLRAPAPAVAQRAASVDMAPCWAVMAVFPERLPVQLDGAFVADSPLSWVARDGSKPGRAETESWVLHGSPDWSRRNLDETGEEIAPRLLAAFSEALGRKLPEPRHVRAKRWLFALPVEPLPEQCLFQRELAIAACGDWCGGPRVEGAFLSGCAAAGRILSLRPGPAQATLFEQP